MNSRSKTLEKLNNKTIIDIKKFPREESKILLAFIDFLKKREKEMQGRTKKRKISFREWNLNTKSKLSRKEIYDYL